MVILGIPGSLRRGSFNAALLRAATEVAPPGCRIETGSIREIPLYDADIDAPNGPPPSVLALKQRVLDADGLLLASPEYNHSVPGVLKNAIDWISRRPSPFPGKPVAVIGASSGRGGTAHGQAAWLPVFQALRLRPFEGAPIQVTDAAEKFVDGNLVDDALRDRLREFVAGFAAFVSASGA